MTVGVDPARQVHLRADRDQHLSSGTAAVFDTVGALITWMRDAIARDSARPTR